MVWWIIPLAFALIHNVKAVNEDPVEKEESGKQECSLETCSSALPPIPVMIQRLNRPERVEKAIQGVSEPHQSDGDIKTSFTCDDKPYIPGLYADMKADCQVFHLCLNKITDHFTCPKGTAFDQKYLVCRTEGSFHCKQSASFYVMNKKLPESFQIFSDLEELDEGYDNRHFYLDLLRNIQNSDPSLLDRDVMRALILLQFVEASNALPNLRNREELSGLSRQGRQMQSRGTTNVLSSIVNIIFPILPVKYTSDPEQDSHTKAPDQNFPTRSHFSQNPDQRVLQIVEMILETIGDVYGKIKGISRRNIVQNHINYLHALSGLLSG